MLFSLLVKVGCDECGLVMSSVTCFNFKSLDFGCPECGHPVPPELVDLHSRGNKGGRK